VNDQKPVELDYSVGREYDGEGTTWKPTVAGHWMMAMIIFIWVAAWLAWFALLFK
jgi:hypothetical protein